MAWLRTAMKITILYFDGCPNWQIAVDRVQQISGQQPAIEMIGSSEEAVRREFRGSPTILVDGIDPFADPAAPVGRACRLYRTETGLEGSPSVAQLRAAISGTPGR